MNELHVSGFRHRVKVWLIKLGLYNIIFPLYATLKLRNLGVLYRNYQYSGKNGPDGLAIPPTKLIYQVAGSYEINWFLEAGRYAADTIVEVLAKNNYKLNEMDKVLDFGCGCGRVLRYWKDIDTTEFFGTDYNPELIQWARNNLPFCDFSTNKLDPPLAYPDNSFDLIYTLSVFTHLNEDQQNAWLVELKRILKPGGLLFVTLHGDYYQDQLEGTDKQDYVEGKFVVVNTSVAGSNFCGAYHPKTYVKNSFSEGFRILDHIEQGARGNPSQDVYLLKLLDQEDRSEI